MLLYSARQMTQRVLILILACVALPWNSLNARDATPSTTLDLGLSLYGSGVQSTVSETKTAGTEVEPVLTHRLLPDLQAEVAASLKLETGAHRARFSNEFRPQQVFRLRVATLTYSGLSSRVSHRRGFYGPKTTGTRRRWCTAKVIPVCAKG